MSIDGVTDLDAMEEENELLAQRSDSSSSEDGSSSSSEDSDVEVDGAEEKPPSCSTDSEFYVNTNSLVVHLRKAPGVFRCGRRISSSYHPIPFVHGFRCGKCFLD